MKYQKIKSQKYQITLEDDGKYQVEYIGNKTSAVKGFVIFKGSEQGAIKEVLSLDKKAIIND